MKLAIFALAGIFALGAFALPGDINANTTSNTGPWQRDGNTFASCRSAGHDVYCCKYKMNSAGHITTHNGHWAKPDRDCTKSKRHSISYLHGKGINIPTADIHSPCSESEPRFENGPYCCNTIRDFSKTGNKKNFACAKVGLGFDD